jgi:signal peptidase II
MTGIPAAAAQATSVRRTARGALVLTTLTLTASAALARVFAERALTDGPGPWLGPLQLQLTYNPGVAFSIGNTLPGWLITAGTSVLTLLIGIFAWRTAQIMPAVGRLGLAAVLAGALANVIDRATDGVVTDYLHTGWFPTFNLPDVFITCGACLMVIGTLRSRPAETGSAGDRAVGG